MKNYSRPIIDPLLFLYLKNFADLFLRKAKLKTIRFSIFGLKSILNEWRIRQSYNLNIIFTDKNLRLR